MLDMVIMPKMTDISVFQMVANTGNVVKKV